MSSNLELSQLFFYELKQYNSTNFKALANIDISSSSPIVLKAFSSLVTRYFIFKEKHPEIKESDLNMLYYKLKLDLVAKYFSEYPDASPDNLIAFQIELNNYLKKFKGSEEDD